MWLILPEKGGPVMKKLSVFFSEHGRGWEQVEIPVSLLECEYDSLVNWAAWETRQKGLKGFLVSENPNPFPLLKRRARSAGRTKSALRTEPGGRTETVSRLLQESFDLPLREQPVGIAV
jgi:hypothetical protein